MRNIVSGIVVGAWLIACVNGCANEHTGLDQRESGQAKSRLVFCCQVDNDLLRVLGENEIHCPYYDTPAEAVGKAPVGSGVLILADGYPEHTTTIEPAILDAATAKGLRLYVEYPTQLTGVDLEKPRGIRWERAVVTSQFFGPTLDKMRILSINGCRFTPVKATSPHLVLARVAGYDTAVFGLPKETFPVLFEHPRGNVLVATTKLSQFVAGRYGPTEAWRSVWQGILHWLDPQTDLPALHWEPTVQPSYSRNAKLPDNVEHQAFRRGINWYRRGGQLVHASREKLMTELINHEDRWGPLAPNTPVGDGSCGLLEGYCSAIDHLGRQSVRYMIRNDCTGESAMAFAFGGCCRS